MASVFRNPAAITLVGGSTFVGNLLLMPVLQRIAAKAFVEIMGRFYHSFEAQKEQLVRWAGANLWLNNNINKEFQQLITLLKTDVGNTVAIRQHIDTIGRLFLDILPPHEREERNTTLQSIIDEFKSLDEAALKSLLLEKAAATSDVIDGTSLLSSEIASGILGLSIAIFASVGYVGIFDIAGQLSEFLRISPQFPGLAKFVQTVAFMSTAIPIFALVYEYGFLVVRHLTDSPLIKSNLDFLSSRSKIFIAFCGAVLCAIGTAPLVFLALMEHLPVLMSAFFTPVGAWFLEIRNTINLITAHFEEKEKAKVLKTLDTYSPATETKTDDRQPGSENESDVLTSKIVDELHQVVTKLNSVYSK